MSVTLLLLPALAVLGAFIGFSVVDEKDRGEEQLFYKLCGYGLLGYVTVPAGGIPLPVGFVLAVLLSTRAPRNRLGRRAAALGIMVIVLIDWFIR